MTADTADSLGRLACQPLVREFRQQFRAANNRAEARVSEKVVAHPMALRQAGLTGEVFGRVEKIDGRHARIFGHVEFAPGEQFVQIPGATGGNSRRRRFDKFLDELRLDGIEDAFKNEQVDIFIAQRETKVIAESVSGPVPFVEDAPARLLARTSTDMLG